MKHLDMFGKEIKIGDYILYAGMRGNSADMKVGKVISLQIRTSERNYNQCPTITVIGIRKGYQGNWYRNSRKGIIDRLDNVFVVHEAYVPKKLKELMEGADDDNR